MHKELEMVELSNKLAKRGNAASVGITASVLLSIVALALAALALTKPTNSRGPGSETIATESSLSSVLKTGILRVGYGTFPPYTLDDPTEKDQAKRIKGFSIDLISEIALRTVPPLKLEFFPFSWDSLRLEVESGKFDVVADPVFQTIPRAADFRLTRPYSYFGIAVAIVRKDETRFTVFSDLDRPDITISLAENWTSGEFARQQLKKPKFNSIPVTGHAFTQLDQVLLGRADVALNDVPTVAQYARAHRDTVKALWLDNPPSSVPGGFLVRK